jgi:hypothetical protein
LREPVGVAALIPPFNGPLTLGTQKAAPALAAGCTVILNPLQIDAGGSEVGMRQLALDDVQRHALPGQLERMRVAQLVRSKPAPDARVDGDSPEFAADCGTGPLSPARRAVDDAKQRPDRKLDARRDPRTQLLPAPLVHPDLAPAPALAAADKYRSAPRVEVVLGQRERLLDAHPGAPQHDDHRAQPPPAWRSSPVGRMTATISSTVGGSAGYDVSRVVRRSGGVLRRARRARATAAFAALTRGHKSP